MIKSLEKKEYDVHNLFLKRSIYVQLVPPVQSAVLGIQHAFAMFGATVLAPFLMGFDPNLAIFMSGICTILFFLMTGGRVPSYLGSSFAFIGVVIAATGYAASGTGAPNANLAVAAGGIMACGVLYALFGLMVMATGPVTVKGVAGNPFNMWMALVTVLCMGSIAVFTKGLLQRLLLLIGLLLAYLLYFIISNVMGYGTPINFTPIQQAAWFGFPTFHSPQFDVNAMLIIAPVALGILKQSVP